MGGARIQQHLEGPRTVEHDGDDNAALRTERERQPLGRDRGSAQTRTDRSITNATFRTAHLLD